MKYGFNDFKLKGGVLAGEEEAESIVALASVSAGSRNARSQWCMVVE